MGRCPIPRKGRRLSQISIVGHYAYEIAIPPMRSARASAACVCIELDTLGGTVDKPQEARDGRPATSRRQLKHRSPRLDLENIPPLLHRQQAQQLRVFDSFGCNLLVILFSLVETGLKPV